MLLIRPAAAQRVTVFGSTRNRLATSPGVNKRSRDSTMTSPSVVRRTLHLRDVVSTFLTQLVRPTDQNDHLRISCARRTLVSVARVWERFGANSEIPAGSSPARAVLAYNLARLALFGMCVGLGWVAGLRGLLLFVIALAVSGVLSWFLLAKQRINMGAAIERTVSRSRERMAARTAAEDAYVDELQGDRPAGDNQAMS